jgi:hypothetical protein
MALGQTLLQWQAPGCHMALLFGADDRIIKITHEYAKYQPAPSYQPASSGCMGTIIFVGGVLTAVGAVIKHFL